MSGNGGTSRPAGVDSGARRFNIGVNALAFAGLIVVALLIINYLSTKAYGRFDLTEDKLYTLSASSKKLVSKLPRAVKVKMFVSEKLLPGFRETARYVRDLLDEYKNASKGRVKWEVIHPEQEDKYKKEAERYGIKPFVARAKTAKAMEARTITFGLAITYKPPGKNEDVEVIPLLRPGIEANIEYLISERIKRLTVKRRQLLVLSGHNEFPMQAQQKVKAFLEQMFKDYEVRIHTPRGKKKLPDNADILLILTPQTPYNEEELAMLDQFVMQGKAALFMVDGMVRRQQRRMMPNQPMPNIFMGANTGLAPLLKKWGVTINPDVVMDHQLQLFPTGRGVIFHPAIPAIKVPGLRQTITPFLASTLSVKKAYLGKSKKGKPFRILPLLVTTRKAWTQRAPFIFDIRRKPRPPSGVKLQAYLMAVGVEGRLPSYAAEKKPDDPKLMKESRGVARVAVISDTDMLWLSRRMRGNSIFLRNLMDWLAQDETLVKLRNKSAQNRDLEMPESRGGLIGIKIANILGVPMVVILLGFGLWFWRRSRRAGSSL